MKTKCNLTHAFPLLAASYALVAPGLAAELSPTDWPQWRSNHRDGRVAGPAWPADFSSAAPSRLWRVELGPSYSGPVIWSNLVFTTETIAKTTETVTAFDRHSGQQVWRNQWAGAISVPFFAKANGDWIRSTPACDGESLFVAGMRDVLVCLEARTGRERWRYDFVQKLSTPLPDFGFVCSPLVDDDAVYVQAGASLAKLNKRTGDLLWRALPDQGGMWGSAFSSPVLVELAGRRQLVVQTREKLAGVDPADGSELWSHKVEAFRGMNILTPVVQEDLIFTSAYGGKTIALRVSETGGRFNVMPTWSYKAQGYMSTPVVHAGVAYHHLRSQRVIAIELATGRELWTSDERFGKYWSLVAQGDRLLALDERGWLFLLQANPAQLEVTDRLKISQADTWAHLAVSGDQLFIRELNALAAYRWSTDYAPSHATAP
ncbi:MAG: PQQ-like beta-propeller repeat protein [Verrucomicrobiae bacterium]|nr:PQQ-like beta-propeller repeat protein [Verrucomicrobiae bacterium]